MSVGPCPVCNKEVSSTADICTFCGNTNFLRKTGKDKRIDCGCLGSNAKCRKCKGQGYYLVPEIRDTRMP
jgi:hypothetical protein